MYIKGCATEDYSDVLGAAGYIEEEPLLPVVSYMPPMCDLDYYSICTEVYTDEDAAKRAVEFFAGYVVSVENDAWNTSFISGEEFIQWLTAAQERSLFSSAINPAECDRIITLSTCSYEFYNARFVVLGKIS